MRDVLSREKEYEGCTERQRDRDRGPVHTMPDKLKNKKRNFIVTDTASVHTNMHKKIHENGTF